MRNVKYSIFLMLALFCISCGSQNSTTEPQQGLVSGQLDVDSSIIETDVNLSEFKESGVYARINEENGTHYISLHFYMVFTESDIHYNYELDVLKIPTDQSNITYPVKDLDTIFATTYDIYTVMTTNENVEGSLNITELSLSEISQDDCGAHVGYIQGTLSMQGTYYLKQASAYTPNEPYPFDIVFSSSFEAPVSVWFSNCGIEL